jgi:hypothetical protein
MRTAVLVQPRQQAARLLSAAAAAVAPVQHALLRLRQQTKQSSLSRPQCRLGSPSSGQQAILSSSLQKMT